MIMLGTAKEEGFGKLVSPPAKLNGATTQAAYIIVSDADALYDRVTKAGARIVRDLGATSYGSREFACRERKQPRIDRQVTVETRGRGEPRERRSQRRQQRRIRVTAHQVDQPLGGSPLVERRHWTGGVWPDAGTTAALAHNNPP